jgi:Flp pilus assembly protein TadG
MTTNRQGRRPFQWLRGRRASVTVLAAVILPALVGMAGLATEYGNALLIKVKAQRIADAAAYGAAWAYNPANSSDANTSAMNAAANRIALLNGIATTAMAVSIGSSPSGDGNQAVRATVTMNAAVDLGRLINGVTHLSVSANAFVELKNDTLACIIAVKSAGTGVTLSGAGRITANACGVASAATTTSPAAIVAPNGTTVTTPQVTTPQALTTIQKANIQPPAGTGAVTYKVKPVTDPLAGNSEVTTAVSRLSTVGALTNPSAPMTPSGTNPSFGYQPAGTYPIGSCTGTTGAWNGIWVVTCTGAGPFTFSQLNMTSGSSFTFNNSTSAVYNVAGQVNTGSATVTFNGAGTYNIAGGLTVGGGSTTSFTSAATFKIGPNSSCNGGNYSICNTGALLSFVGPSTFVLSNGLYNGGGSTMTVGSGSTSNSYQIGKSSDGYAINMGGGSTVTLNDATAVGDVFTANGNIGNGGGSCLTLPAATQHDINGSIILGGGATLGGGIYTIYNYLALGNAGGGAVTCGGQSIGIKANGVSLIIGGNATVSCDGTVAFCIAGGYSNVTLTAPSIGSTANLAVVGPTVSGNTAGATLKAGASGASITGAFYFPYGTFAMNGGASVGSGGCLELIAAQVNILQGTAVGTLCVGLAANPQKIVLVQ